jgi:hypothetical protein
LAGAVLTLLWMSGATACFIKRTRLADKVSNRVTGPIGWYRVTNLLGVNWRGLATIPKRDLNNPNDAENDDYDEDRSLDDRIHDRFERQFSSLLLDEATDCGLLGTADHSHKGPVIIFVHGVRGIGSEMWPTIPTLAMTDPQGMFLFRWSVTQTRDVILENLVRGVNRITACSPKTRVIVIAHSAGGVLMSFAASRLQVGDHPLEVWTVASPLAGVGYHSKIDNEDDDTRFFNDLGSTKDGYTAAAPNVTVFHYRTTYPADQVMKPNPFGHAPNQRGCKVANATEIDLPTNLTHDGSVLYIAQQLAIAEGVQLPSTPDR